MAEKTPMLESLEQSFRIVTTSSSADSLSSKLKLQATTKTQTSKIRG